MNKLNPKLLIFDFDGTLADTWNVYEHAIPHFLEQEGVSIARSLIHKLMGRKVKHILPELGVRNQKIINSVKKSVNEYALEHAKQIKKCKGINVLKKLKKKYKMFIVSNSITKDVKKMAYFLKIEKYFNKIIGGEHFIFKEHIIKKIMKEKKLKKSEVIYIGDRAGDSEIARKAGCLSIIIANSCSWNSKDKIIGSKPDFVVSSLDGLKKILE